MSIKNIIDVEDILSDAESVNLWEYSIKYLPPELAVIMSKILLPNFIEVNGVVFLKNNYNPEISKQWLLRPGMTYVALQDVINHVHLYDVFKLEDDTDQLNALRYILTVMEKTWSLALNLAYPERKFIVECTDEPQDYGPTIYFRELIS